MELIIIYNLLCFRVFLSIKKKHIVILSLMAFMFDIANNIQNDKNSMRETDYARVGTKEI